jgi:hypothetical protein
LSCQVWMELYLGRSSGSGPASMLFDPLVAVRDNYLAHLQLMVTFISPESILM